MKSSNVFAGVPRVGVRAAVVASFAVLMTACSSSPTFETPDTDFTGRLSIVDSPVVLPGSEITIAGEDFKPGQEVRFFYDGESLLGKDPLVAGADGKFRSDFKVPANAQPGEHPVVVSVSNPVHAYVQPLKVSPDVPLSGQDNYTLESKRVVQGLYQSAYSAKSDRIFVGAAVGRPPVTNTQLVKINPQTLEIERNVSPHRVPSTDGRDAGLYAIYGVAVDDVNGTVWVTNTRQDTVAVYRQSDLALLKQFEPGLVPHSRDVVVDERLGKVYVSAVGAPHIAVFDAESFEFLKNIPIETTVVTRGFGQSKSFAPMTLSLDAETHKLFTVGLSTEEVAVIDTRTDTVEKVFVVDGSKSASGVAYHAPTNRVLVAAQGSDNLLIVDLASGETLHDVKVGAGPLNVMLDAAGRHAYVSNRGAGTVTVVNLEGEIVANLPIGTFPNHVSRGPNGALYAVNKSRSATDPEGDLITRITPR